ncbi:3'-5' exonuclease [Polynucleobacter sp. MWH-Adler-W8]|jgi:exodeoxyribonuclease X|uniref:3'-5' exonuclease n=1 Tax=Polynucleobacter sp. MWH-Adler-W8 TaxID=1819727 RepID=UPI00092BDDC6|nr:3'-5' exonuclease [Polynucleobacter sp. MWH-Adler-W8]OJI05550.1 DNA polymerase III subunit epsilon [Polynucleobacter sp. MWH-Adler-W8]
MPQAIIFDVEATDKNDAVIIEAASLDVTSLNPFEVGNPWVQRYNPGKPISLGALATHHIMDEELVNCPASSSFRLPAGTKYLIGHNIDFDWVAIGSPEVKRICTLALARSLWPDLDSYTQSALLYYFERHTARDQLRNAHSALADVWICSKIVAQIIDKLHPVSLDALWEMSEKARIPKTMPYGKHKGELISQVPSDYKQWLLGQDNVSGYLRKALEAN